MYKNTAGQTITLLVIDTTTNKPKAGDSANLTFYYKADGGSVTALNASPTEDSATNAKGLYTATLLQAETNGDKITYSGKSSTADIEVVPFTVYTDPPNQTLLNIDSSGRVVLQPTQTGVTIPTVTTVTGGATSTNVSDAQTAILAKLPSSLVGGRIDASVGAIENNAITTASINDGAITSAKFGSGALDAVWSTGTRTLTGFGTLVADIWSYATRILTAGTNISLAKGTGVTGFNDLDAAGVRGAVGLATANLDTQLSAIDDFLDTEIAAIKSKTDNLPASPAAVGDIPSASTVASTVWGNATRTLSSGSNIVLAKGTGITGFNDLDAAGIRSSIGLAAANLDTQLTTIDDFLDTEVAAIKAKTDNLPATPASSSDIPSAATVASTVWGNATRTLSAGTNIVLAKGTGITGFNDLDAAGVRSAVGMSSANMDTQLASIISYIDTEIAAIKAKTDNLPVDPADASDIAASFSSLASTLSTIASYIDTEVAAIKAKTDNLPATPASTSDIPSTSSITSAVWSNATRTLSAGTNIVLSKGVGITGFNDLDAAGVRTAVGLASANLDTQLTAIDDFLDTEIAAIKSKTDNLPATPASSSDVPSAATVASTVWSNASRTLSAGTNIVLAKGVGITGFNDIDATGIRSAVGLASANLDTQLGAIDDFLDTEIAAIKAKTDNLPASPAAVSNIPTVVQIRQEMDANSVKLSEIKALTILGSGDQTSADFSNDYYNAVADAVLTRNISNVEDTLAEHTLGGAIMGQLEWSLDSSGNLTVYKTDGTTELYTKVVNSTPSNGNVITGLE